MVTTKSLEEKARAIGDATEHEATYHGPLHMDREFFETAETVARQVIRKGEIDTGAVLQKSSSPEAAARDGIAAIQTHELARFLSPDTLSELTFHGREAIDLGLDRSHPLLRRGRLQSTEEGGYALPLRDGNRVALSETLQQDLAQAEFRMASGFAFRAPMVLPADFLKKLQTLGTDKEWTELEGNQRGKYFQGAYEMMLTLAALESMDPATHRKLLATSEKLHTSGGGTLQPLLNSLSREFQLRFAETQKDVAWSWRNQLEPGKSLKPPPDTSESSMLMRNQMGLGMLEYLLPAGKATLEYMRAYGQSMAASPFRRTEIGAEHMGELLVGVPLQGGKILAGTPAVLLHFAKEHHELWRFAREVSWLLPDESYHQPKRHAHVPWSELDTPTRNKDILNIFGVAFMLGQLSESDFNMLSAAAAPGNPAGFVFDSIQEIPK